MVRAFTGQAPTHTPQPMQSSGTDGHGELYRRPCPCRPSRPRSWRPARGVLGLLRGQGEGTDGGVGADIGALVALDALGRRPRRARSRPRRASHRRRRPARTGRPRARQKAETGRLSPSMRAHGLQDLLDHLHQLAALPSSCSGHRLVHGVGPVGGHVELLEGGGAHVDGLVVHIHHVLALLQVGVPWPSSFM